MKSFKKQLDYSVVIPTYNRAHLLTHAIISALKQKGVLLEVIVIDDCSTDKTEEVVKKIKDKRIRYFKNKNRLGYALNLKKCFYKSRGRYIFTLGDDDFILEDDALLNVLRIMKKNKTGMGRIGSIAYANRPQDPTRVYTNSDKLIVLKPNGDKKLLIKALDFNLAAFSGLVFDSLLINKSMFINQINFPYYPMALEVIKKHGFVYVPNYFVVNALSYQMVPIYVSLKKHGGFYLFDLLKIVENFVNAEDLQIYKKKIARDIISMLPTVKLYSNNKNLLSIINILIRMDNSLVFDIRLIMFVSLALMPKFLINGLRSIAIFLSEKKAKKIVEKYNYFLKLTKWSFIRDYE